MTDSRIEDTRNYYKNDIERREKNIAGLKAIGKNYNYKKDGGQFTDVRKTLDGVDGIAKVERVTSRTWDRNARADFQFWNVRTTSNGVFDIRIEYPSIADIEASIQRTIAEEEKFIAIDKETIDGIDKAVAECDDMIDQIAAIVPDGTDEERVHGSDENLTRIMWGYMKQKLDDMFSDKISSYYGRKKTA